MADRKRDYRKALKSFVYELTHGRCGYCGDELKRLDFSVDHIDPYGPDQVSNYMASCRSCNSTKGQKSLEEFRSYISIKWRHPEVKIPGHMATWLLDQDWYPHTDDSHSFYFEELGGD